jgi:predicted SprT family Zn-dependent metalloprotease
LKIPSTFQLAGITWQVEEVDKLIGAYGVTHLTDNVIQVLNTLKPPQRKQTFCHELVHVIMFSMGKNMPHDEEFVDAFAHFLHQYLETAK